MTITNVHQVTYIDVANLQKEELKCVTSWGMMFPNGDAMVQ